MWEDAKARSQRIVAVKTDDTEINVGHLIGDTRDTFKIAVFVPTRRPDLSTQETGRAYRCQILAVQKHRVLSMTERN